MKYLRRFWWMWLPPVNIRVFYRLFREMRNHPSAAMAVRVMQLHYGRCSLREQEFLRDMGYWKPTGHYGIIIGAPIQ